MQASPSNSATEQASLEPAAAMADATCRVAGNRAAALVDRRGFGEAIDTLPDARFGLALAAGSVGWLPTPHYGRAPDAVLKSA